MSRVLVTGANGYVGGRLVPVLLAAGHEVVAAVRTPERLAPFWWREDVEVRRLDVLDAGQCDRALRGVEVMYHLVHGLSGRDFLDSDRRGARHVAGAARRHGLDRVIYLGGLVPPIADDDLSDHLFSRREVEDVLAVSEVPTLVVRAAILIGAASTSFEIVRQVSRRLPLVQPLPTWMDSLVEPVAVTDVLVALVRALELPATPSPRVYDIGGGERLSYAALLRRFAAADGLLRLQVPLPPLPAWVVGAGTSLFTDVDGATVSALVHSLEHDMVAGGLAGVGGMGELSPPGHAPTPLDEAIRRALTLGDPQVADRDRDLLGPLRSDPAWAGGAR